MFMSTVSGVATAQRDVRTLKEVAGDAEQASARFTSGGRGG
jgi:hypothetical protein